jgi:hypothetical protein
LKRASIFLPAAASRKHGHLRAACGRDLVMIARVSHSREPSNCNTGRHFAVEDWPISVTGHMAHDIVIGRLRLGLL